MSTIKSFAVGNGDMFYIEHGSDSFTIIDCCLSDDNQDGILAEIAALSGQKGVTRVISTHPDDDHICGPIARANALLEPDRTFHLAPRQLAR